MPRSVSVSVLFLLSTITAPAWGEPYFAQREGFKCSRCHVNRTGGGKRTDFGYQYGITHLDAFRTIPTSVEEIEGDGDGSSLKAILDPNLGDYLSVGANLRLAHSTVFADETANTFSVPEANLYLAFELSSLFVAYVDVSVAEGSVESREAFALFSPTQGLHLKAGYFLLPYGLRIWGDDELVRQITGFNYAAPDLGLELGYEHGPWSAYLAVANGAGGGIDADNGKLLTALAEASWGAFRMGVSGSFNRTDARDNYLGGVYLGLTLGRLVLLAEADLVARRFRAQEDTVQELVAYAELDVLLMRGLNLKASYGYHDPALDVAEDQRMNVRGGLELFPAPFFAATVFYNLKASVPQDEVGNADVLFAELHVYF